MAGNEYDVFIGKVGRSSPPLTPAGTPGSEQILLREPPTPAPPAEEGYDAFVPKPNSAAAISAAQKGDADKFAAARKLGAETGLPADVVERNMEEVRRRKNTEEADFQLAQSPGTKRWLLADPDNVKLSHDSVKMLTATEQLLGLMRSAAAGGVRGQGAGFSGVGEGLEILGRATGRGVAAALKGIGLGDVADTLLAPTPWWMTPSALFKAVGDPAKAAADAIDIPPEDRRFVNDVAGGVGQVAGQITVQILTAPLKGVTAGANALSLFGQGVDQVADDVKKAGKQGTVAGDLASVGGGAITAVTEKFGLDVLLKHVPAAVHSHIGRILAGAGSEAAQEISEKVLNNIAAIALYDSERKIIDSDAIYEGGVGGAVGAIVSAAIPGKKAIRARKDLEKLSEDITKSPLATRAPDKAIEHFNEVLADSGVELYVSGEKLAGVLGNDPAKIAELGLDAQLADAVQRGGDVKLTGEMFAKMSLDGTALELLDHMRVGGDAMTADEAKNVPDALAEQRAEERDMEAQAQAEKDAAPPALDEETITLSAPKTEEEKVARKRYLRSFNRTLNVALHGKSGQANNSILLEDALKLVIDHDDASDPSKRLAEALLKTPLPPVPVEGSSTNPYTGKRNLPEGADGATHFSEDTGQPLLIALNAYKRKNNGSLVGVPAGILLHEAVHVQTYQSLRALPKEHPHLVAIDALLADYTTALKAAEGGPDKITAYAKYAAKDRDEFIATLFGQRSAQKFASSVKLSPETAEKVREALSLDVAPTTLWDAFVASVKRVLGIESAPDSVLEATILVGGRLIENNASVAEGTTIPGGVVFAPDQHQKRQLKAAGFSPEDIAAMSQEDVEALVDPPAPKPSKWEAGVDEAVTLAEDQLALGAMFATAKEAGMTDAEYASYLIAIQESADGTRKRAEARILREKLRETRDEWKAEREVVQQQTEESLHQEPVYAALDSLGVDRLDRAAIVEVMGQESFPDLLPKHMGRQIHAAQGIHPDVLAQQYGFESGKELLDAVMKAPAFKEAVAKETDRRMTEKHGTILDEQRMLKKAIEDLHNDDTAKVLTAELNALRSAKKEGALKPSLFRQAAKLAMGAIQINQINPKLFLDEEARKGKLAGKLIRGKGKVDGQTLDGPNRSAAATAKYQQILNFEYARQAFQVRRAVEVARAQIQRLAGTSKPIPGIDAKARDKIFEMLDGFSFSKTREPGAGVTGPIHYSDMSLNAFNRLYEDVKLLQAEGTRERAFVKSGQKLDFEESKAEIVAAMEQLPTLDRVAAEATGEHVRFEKLRKAAAGAGAFVKKIELLMHKLDGKIAGPLHRAVFQRVADAQTVELDMYDDKLKELVQGWEGLPKSTRKGGNKKVFVPSLGRHMTTTELMMVGLNAGNESNHSKMIAGSKRLNNATPWTSDGVQEALDLLGPEEAKWIQKVWDKFEEMRPRVEEVYRNAHGISPERIEPREVTIGGVKLKGGYFPMIYKRDAAPPTELGNKSVVDLMKNTYEKDSVFNGMTISRIEDYAAPVEMDISKLAHALRQTIHFISYYDAVVAAEKVLNDPQINNMIGEKVGPENRKALREWLGAVATNNSDQSTNHEVNSIIQEVRSNLTIGVLGLSWTTGVSQLFGFTTSVAALGQDGGKFKGREGAKWMLVGLDRYLANPAEATREVVAQSGEMRHRLGNAERDLAQAIGATEGATNWFRILQRASMKTIGGIQFYSVDMPTWLGAYNKALSQGQEDADAIKYADDLVRTSQSSGHTKDLTALQREKGAWLLTTMFTSYTSLLYGLVLETASNARKPANIPGAVSRLGWLLAASAVADAFMRGDGPPDDDDPEQKAAWWGAKVSLYGLKAVPVVGGMAASSIEGFQAAMSPVEALLGRHFPNAIKSLWKLTEDNPEWELKDTRQVLTAVGLTIGLPGTTQAARILKAAEDEDAGINEYLAGKPPKSR